MVVLIKVLYVNSKKNTRKIVEIIEIKWGKESIYCIIICLELQRGQEILGNSKE